MAVNQLAMSQNSGDDPRTEDGREAEMVPVKQPNGTYHLEPPTRKAGTQKERCYVYRNTLTTSAVHQAGDGRFTAPRQRWIRLLRVSPIFCGGRPR